MRRLGQAFRSRSSPLTLGIIVAIALAAGGLACASQPDLGPDPVASPSPGALTALRPLPGARCSTTRNPAGRSGRHGAVPPPIAVADGLASANLWNVVSSAGLLQQCDDTSGLTTMISLRDIQRGRQAPAGYPEVGYGRNLVDGDFCLNASRCHTRPFPLRVSALERSRSIDSVDLQYALGVPAPPSLSRNFAYDLWLERHPAQGAGPQRGDIEVMISLYHVGGLNCGAAGVMWWQQASVNGESTGTRWQVCNLEGATGAQLVGFLLERPAPAPARSISLPLQPFIDQAVREANLGPDGGSYSLMGVELGAEFGNCDHFACAKTARWRFRISRLVVHTAALVVPIIGPRPRPVR